MLAYWRRSDPRRERAVAEVRIDRRAILLAARREARANLTTGLRRAQGRAKILAPVDTGRLRSDIRFEIRNRALGVTGRLFCTVSYADAVHDGTRPHVIRPRRPGGVLRFRVGGQVVYAKFVNHPGTTGRPFLSQALREVGPTMGWSVSGQGAAP